VAELFRGRAGVGRVLVGADREEAGLVAAGGGGAADRCGDVVIESTLDSWQCYFYWLDDARAPSFARTIDIHRKPGYDPLELHLDRGRLPAVAIPLDVSLVKGSHGAVDPHEPHETLFVASRPGLAAGPLEMREVAGVVRRIFNTGT